MTDVQTPSYTIDKMAGTLEVSAISATTVHIKSLDGADLIVNGIAVNFRAYMVRRQNGSWFAEDLFAWRSDRFGARATDNQTQKLYRMCVEIAEGVSESFLNEGERGEALRAIEATQREIVKLEADLNTEQRRYDALCEAHGLV